jgi:hypothetical protein
LLLDLVGQYEHGITQLADGVPKAGDVRLLINLDELTTMDEAPGIAEDLLAHAPPSKHDGLVAKGALRHRSLLANAT